MAEPQVGDFGLVWIPNAAGWGIRAGQWLCGDGFRHWVHAFIYLGAGTLMEAAPGGVRTRQLTDYAAWPVAWSTVPLTDEQRHGIADTALSLEGTPYSFLDYFAIAAHRFHLPAPGLRAYIASTGHLICSQMVDYCYMRNGAHLFQDGRWEGYVTPADLRPFTDYAYRIPRSLRRTL